MLAQAAMEPQRDCSAKLEDMTLVQALRVNCAASNLQRAITWAPGASQSRGPSLSQQEEKQRGREGCARSGRGEAVGGGRKGGAGLALVRRQYIYIFTKMHDIAGLYHRRAQRLTVFLDAEELTVVPAFGTSITFLVFFFARVVFFAFVAFSTFLVFFAFISLVCFAFF